LGGTAIGAVSETQPISRGKLGVLATIRLISPVAIAFVSEAQPMIVLEIRRVSETRPIFAVKSPVFPKHGRFPKRTAAVFPKHGRFPGCQMAVFPKHGRFPAENRLCSGEVVQFFDSPSPA
jgi:hypothetical protein